MLSILLVVVSQMNWEGKKNSNKKNDHKRYSLCTLLQHENKSEPNPKNRVASDFSCVKERTNKLPEEKSRKSSGPAPSCRAPSFSSTIVNALSNHGHSFYSRFAQSQRHPRAVTHHNQKTNKQTNKKKKSDLTSQRLLLAGEEVQLPIPRSHSTHSDRQH